MIPALLLKHWRWLAGALGLSLAFAGGWVTHRPARRVQVKVEYRDRVVEVTKEIEHREDARSTDTAATKDKRVRRTEVHRPDGTIVKTETEDTRTARVVHDVQVQYVDRVVEKVVEREVSRVETPMPVARDWRAGAFVGVAPLASLQAGHLDQVTFGARVERRVLGPVFLGVWGSSAGQVGVGVSVDF